MRTRKTNPANDPCNDRRDDPDYRQQLRCTRKKGHAGNHACSAKTEDGYLLRPEWANKEEGARA